jgi:tRNA pseudouridine55 synthase
MIPVIQKTIPEIKYENAQSFILLIDKEEDWTSFDAVKKIRNLLKIKKVGHGGTLDPFATGLLIVGVGQGTKMLNEIQMCSKIYDATIRFGIETDTYDRTGEIVNQVKTEKLDLDEIEKEINLLSGEIEQIPPMYSAKKVDGQRLYKLARQKKEISREPVKIKIFNTQILSWNRPELKLRLHVSKGTYIRSYAHDLGKQLNCGAHLCELRRVSIGSYNVESAFKIPEFIEYWSRN